MFLTGKKDLLCLCLFHGLSADGPWLDAQTTESLINGFNLSYLKLKSFC